MSYFDSLQRKLSSWSSSKDAAFKVYGTSPEQWEFILRELLKNNGPISTRPHIVICPTVEIAESLYDGLKGSFKREEVFFYPGFENNPYSSIVPSERDLYRRFQVLNKLAHHAYGQLILITTIEAFALKIPPSEFFLEHHVKIEKGELISPQHMAQKLVTLGYSPSTTVEEPGTFSMKGEILDVYPLSFYPVRIHYFDEEIEEIYPIDLSTNKSDRSRPVEDFPLCPSPRVLLSKQYSNVLRQNIPIPSTQFKEKFKKRQFAFDKISNNELFDDYPYYTSLFFEKPAQLWDYFDTANAIFHFIESKECESQYLDFYEQLRVQHEISSEDVSSESLLPDPKHLYCDALLHSILSLNVIEINALNIDVHLYEDLEHSVELKLERAISYFNRNIGIRDDKRSFLKGVFEHIGSNFKHSGNIVFCLSSEAAKNEILHLFDILNISNEIRTRAHFLSMKLTEGFYYFSENLLVVAEGDLFATKKSKTRQFKPRNIDLFAEQLATLKKGDYVIHAQHGVGKYLGLESMDVGGQRNDFLIIEYASSDKVYVPVYKINLIQKHAESAANLKLESLRTNKFKVLRARAKESAKKLAFDLIKLQAERESSHAFSFSPPGPEYKEFELAFPFEETPDQRSAIENVVESMQNNYPMDYLVCGDVGFGKTEVAMRAAYKAVLDSKQVAVLVPTTILALQHYNTFVKRFKNFPVRIDFLSRFKTAKEARDIKEQLKNGHLDIIIGTHKLLSKDIVFKDLGLVIVDEEQRFGVAHKEKLKLLKASVDFLTLTATPIPRTLQLAFLGLRELSLIQTAPPKRQSIKTYIIKEDDHTIKSAIEKELQRGGQVFVVHNRVNDIENYTAYIKSLVPNAKIIFAHGQLPERELEKRVSSFYRGEYQILISTTIIESGLDIPSANTMIIDRADTFGLSQLHQLRGRIGRSERKAYAYFIIPKSRNINTIAEKRLKALHTYADIGSGFNIASCDLEIRGAGDILGAQQSGHIESVGLELYMELLQEAIHELKGEKKIIQTDIEITTPFTAHIPEHYITDPSERLKQYKRLSNTRDNSTLESFEEEFTDVYGPLPLELNNLFMLLKARNYLKDTGINHVYLSDRIVTLKFDKNTLDTDEDLRNRILKTFLNRTHKYQITPDYNVIYKSGSSINQTEFVDFCHEIAQQISSY